MKRIFINCITTSLLCCNLIHANTGQWALSIGAGAQRASVENTPKINNGSGFPAPYNEDIFTTHRGRSGMLFLALSRIWSTDNPWLSSLEAGLMLEHLNRINVGGRIIQYSLLDFENYVYQLNATSQQAMLYAKVHIFKPQRLNPFVQLGVGLGKTRISNYNEAPLPNVTPRISPAFAAHNNHKLVTQAGAGIDLRLGEKGSASIAYIYEDLGRIRSGSANPPWSQTLQLGHLRAQQIRIGLQIHIPS